MLPPIETVRTRILPALLTALGVVLLTAAAVANAAVFRRG